ncbi:MAG: PHP domain-containing protein [Candidatus Lokiarchaeota archaeon]|nr:PHP domain-containing protein [Candidatus Lokiarchaeota archaeon]
MIDFHLHSTGSDGLDTPSQLIDKAIELHLKAIALTDHDTIMGLEEFTFYGDEKDIIIIPGIEISIRHEPERGLIDIHVIGLNIDFESTKLINSIEDQIKGRIEQKKAICKRLRNEFEFDITFEEVSAIAGGTVIGRPHIVEIMIKNNPTKIKGKSKNELFKMISIGGEAFVDREVELNLEESIDLIKAAGGVPILAHPGIYEVQDRTKLIEFCMNTGIEGIEIEYTYSKNRPYYETDKATWAQEFFPNYYRKIAENLNLIMSGGSDYHGGKKGIRIGDANVPDKYLKSFI